MERDAYGLCVGGNGKLMKALPLLLADQNQKAGQDVLPVKTLSLTGSPAAQQFIDELARGEGYQVYVKGFKDGAVVDATQNIDIVKGGFTQLEPVIADIKAGKVKYITSNTYKGFDKEYPPQLLQLLKAAYDSPETVAQPIPVFPMELVTNNGDTLKKNVLALVDDYTNDERKESFRQWVEQTYFANTLVDRIVADAPDGKPLAEPFAYIAIEKPKGNIMAPVAHPFGECKEIESVNDINTAQSRKLGILNAMHTSMTQKWILEGREPMTTVKEFMDGHGEWVDNVRKDLVAVVSKMLPDVDVENYSRAIAERFMNPFNNHRLNEIATNHSKKIDERINFVMDWKAKHASDISTPTLDALLEQTISHRQLASAKADAMKVHQDGQDFTNLLDESMKVRNAQPHKGADTHTMEALTTRADIQKALAAMQSRLNTMLRTEPAKVDGILAAYRSSAGVMEGRGVGV